MRPFIQTHSLSSGLVEAPQPQALDVEWKEPVATIMEFAQMFSTELRLELVQTPWGGTSVNQVRCPKGFTNSKNRTTVRVKIITGSLATLEDLFPQNYR